RDPTIATMDIDPPQTLFQPPPTPSQFSGPWAFFQAAEAQRQQRELQMEYLLKLQELRSKDERSFINFMTVFSTEFPAHFAQLTNFMRRREFEQEMERME